MSRSRFDEYQAHLPRLVLPKDEQLQLVREAQAGCQKAKNRLSQASLRLVPHCIRKAGMLSRYDMQGHLMDLVLEGNVGIAIAINKYSFEYDTRFTTYAMIRISSAMYREAAKISVSQGVGNRDGSWRIKAELSDFLADHGRKARTDDELTVIAKQAGVSLDAVREYLKNPHQNVISLDSAKYDEADGETLVEGISDEYAHAAMERSVGEPLLAQTLNEVLASIPETERAVLNALYGLGGGHGRSCQEVGASMGIPASRVQTTEAKALRRIRNSSLRIPLREFREGASE